MDAKLRRELRILKAYAVTSILMFAALLVMAASNERKKQKFDEIDVQRINVVEPDGTLRMIISSKATFPGIIFKGKEYPHPGRQAAGMLFFNDEATENGGLIFGGGKDEKGNAESYGHLSFDAYDQDQVFTVDAGQSGNHKRASLVIVDQPDWPISDLLRLPPAQWEQYASTKPSAHARIFLGRNDDQSASLKMKDVDGRDRIIIRVAGDGSPVIQFLDANGKVVSQIPDISKR